MHVGFSEVGPTEVGFSYPSGNNSTLVPLSIASSWKNSNDALFWMQVCCSNGLHVVLFKK